MIRILAIVAVVAAVAVGGAVGYLALVGGGDERFASCRDTRIAGGAAQIGGPFTLVSETGETVTEAEVIDRPTLVYFGYTSCPDVCPLDASRNAHAVDLLAERGHVVKPVFITIDPARDTPEVLAAFTSYMHPEMVGLTGSDAQVRAASQAYRTYYARRDGDDPDRYLMDHSVFTYLVLPGTGFVEVYRGAPNAMSEGVTAEAVADSVSCYLDAA